MSLTYAQTQATASTTDSVLIAANPARQFLAIQNIGTNAVTINFDAAAVAGSGWSIPENGSVTWDVGAPDNAIHCITASSTSTVIVHEGS